MRKSRGEKTTGRPNRLVALSSAAVLTVYTAGYLRTRAAADRLQLADRGRVVIPDGAGDWSAGRVAPAELPAAPPAEAAKASAEQPPTVSKKASKAGTNVVPAPAPETTVAPTAVSSQASPSPALAATSVPVTSVATTPVATTAVTAPAPAPSPTPEPTPAQSAHSYKDGTYSGWGTSRHGDIEATVVIANGRITSAQITQCWTRYSCSWVAHLQGQVVERQSPEVDYVSGATQSTNAFYYAVVQALSKAK